MLAYLRSLPLCAPLRYLKKYPLLGLDLGFNELRLLQLEKRGKTYHVEKLLIQPLSPESPKQGKKIAWAEVGEQLQALVVRAQLAGSAVALALPSSAVHRVFHRWENGTAV